MTCLDNLAMKGRLCDGGTKIHVKKAVSLDAMKALGGKGGIALLILDLGTRLG
jgi:hypothetical protein